MQKIDNIALFAYFLWIFNLKASKCVRSSYDANGCSGNLI